MNSKAVVVVLVVLCALLGGTLYMRHRSAEEERAKLAGAVEELKRQSTQTQDLLEEQKKVNSALDEQIRARAEELKTVSSHLSNTVATLANTEREAKAAAAIAAAEMAKRDAKIGELEGQRDDLTKKMETLNGSISSLEGKIADTQRKLAASEGDRDFLLKELKRMQTEKAELERQFNDLALLREQVKKLREELSVSRRLDWIRRGLYATTKGAERMVQRPPETSAGKTNYDLNVELRQDGTIKAGTNAPAPAKTNAPPATNAPAVK